MDALIVPILLVVAGLVLLVLGGEFLVRGAATLAAIAKIDPLVIGLTVVAFGTSAPELAVSVQAAFAGKADLALGNVVGSNIANVLLILGLSAVVAPLAVASRLVRLDVPVMIAASVLLLILGYDGTIGWLDGILLFAALIAYTAWLAWQSRNEKAEVETEFDEALLRVPPTSKQILIQLGFIAASVVLLSLGSNWLVRGASDVAKQLGVPDLVIGLTIVALGTSLPELAASVMAALRGQRDIAVGNCVGSNILNILAVMGMTGMVAPDGVPAPPVAIRSDIPIMIAVAVACWPIFAVGGRIARWEGAIFVGYYFAYNAWLMLVQSQMPIANSYAFAMLGLVIPLTVITLIVTSYRTIRSDRRRKENEASG